VNSPTQISSCAVKHLIRERC